MRKLGKFAPSMFAQQQLAAHFGFHCSSTGPPRRMLPQSQTLVSFLPQQFWEPSVPAATLWSASSTRELVLHNKPAKNACTQLRIHVISEGITIMLSCLPPTFPDDSSHLSPSFPTADILPLHPRQQHPEPGKCPPTSRSLPPPYVSPTEDCSENPSLCLLTLPQIPLPGHLFLLDNFHINSNPFGDPAKPPINLNGVPQRLL